MNHPARQLCRCWHQQIQSEWVEKISVKMLAHAHTFCTYTLYFRCDGEFLALGGMAVKVSRNEL